MKLRPIFPEMTLEDLVAVITENFRELERLARRGVRGPLGQPGLPAFGFQNTGFDGVGTSALHDKNGNPAGLLTEADVQRFRASSPSKGSVVEAVPNGVADAGADPARISAYGTDVQADPENYSSADLMAVVDEMRVLSRKFGTAALRDLVLGLLSDSTFTEAMRIAIAETVFNDGGLDRDLRVESDNDPNMILVDASTDRVGIGKVPISTLDVDGSLGVKLNATSTTPTTLNETHHTMLVDATAGAITVNLPVASDVLGRIYVIKKIDASVNAVIIEPNGAELIDGAANRSLTKQWESVTIQSNATSWSIIGDPLNPGGTVAVTDITPVTSDRLIGRDTAGPGAAEQIPVSGGIEFTGGPGIQTSAFTGDVTKAAGGTALTIANDAVTNAKAADMAQSTVKGRAVGAGTGDPTDLTATEATAILDNLVGDSGAGGTKGLAPAPAAGDAAAGKFLKADGTYAVPASGGTWTTVKKTADESVDDSIVLQDDNHLQFAMAASTNYTIRLRAFFNAGATPDFKYRIVGPTAPTLVRRVIYRGAGGVAPAGSPTLTAFDAADIALTGPGGAGCVFEDIIVQNGANSGTFIFRWAQNTKTAADAVTVWLGSYLEYMVTP